MEWIEGVPACSMASGGDAQWSEGVARSVEWSGCTSSVGVLHEYYREFPSCTMGSVATISVGRRECVCIAS